MVVDGGSGDFGSGSGDELGDLGSGSGDVLDDASSGSGESGVDDGARPLTPPLPPYSPPLPAAAAAAASPPAVVIALAAERSPVLLVRDGSALAALPAPFVIRVAVGLPSQEDLTVASTEPLHGQGEDGRFRLRLAIPTRFAHQAGELLRHVELTRVQGDALVVLRGGGLTQL